MYYIIPWSYFAAFSFSQAMPDKVNARYGAKASDLQIRPYPMGMKEISALDTIRLKSSGERQTDYYALSCLANSGDKFLTLPKELVWEGSEAVFPSASPLAQDGAPQERLIVRGIRSVVGRLGMGWDLDRPPVPGAQWS